MKIDKLACVCVCGRMRGQRLIVKNHRLQVTPIFSITVTDTVAVLHLTS